MTGKWNSMEMEPMELEDEDYFHLNPMAIIEHARRRDRRKTTDYDIEKVEGSDADGEYVGYWVLSEERHENGVHLQWRLGYGVRCYDDGSSKAFLRYNPEDREGSDAAACTIANDIFPPLLKRSVNHILEGEI